MIQISDSYMFMIDKKKKKKKKIRQIGYWIEGEGWKVPQLYMLRLWKVGVTEVGGGMM